MKFLEGWGVAWEPICQTLIAICVRIRIQIPGFLNADQDPRIQKFVIVYSAADKFLV